MIKNKDRAIRIAQAPDHRPARTTVSNYLDDAFRLPDERAETRWTRRCAWLKVRRTILMTTASGSADCPTKKAVVELDSFCCMHGTYAARGASVGGVRNIKNVSLAAKAVMQHHRTRHAGGRRAPSALSWPWGYPRENLLTEHSRKDLAAVERGFTRPTTGGGPGLARSALARLQHRSRAGEKAAVGAVGSKRIQNLQARGPPNLGIEPGNNQLAAVRKVLFSPPSGNDSLLCNER